MDVVGQLSAVHGGSQALEPNETLGRTSWERFQEVWCRLLLLQLLLEVVSRGWKRLPCQGGTASIIQAWLLLRTSAGPVSCLVCRGMGDGSNYLPAQRSELGLQHLCESAARCCCVAAASRPLQTAATCQRCCRACQPSALYRLQDRPRQQSQPCLLELGLNSSASVKGYRAVGVRVDTQILFKFTVALHSWCAHKLLVRAYRMTCHVVGNLVCQDSSHLPWRVLPQQSCSVPAVVHCLGQPSFSGHRAGPSALQHHLW